MFHDLAAASIWAGVNGCLAWVAWKATLVFFPEDRSVFARGIHAIALAWGTVTAAGIVLGALGLLTSLLFLPLVLLVSLGFHFRFSRVRMAPAEAAAPESWLDRLAVAIWLVAAGVVVGDTLLEGLGGFPTEFDALTYHVPLVDHWLQAGSLDAPDAYLWFNPGTAELLSLWLVGPFSGDFLIALTNLPAFFLLAFAAIEIATSFGFPRVASLAVGLVVAFQPVLWKQLLALGNDVAVAALALAALWYGVRLAGSPRRATVLTFLGMSLGLLAGVKYYALGYAATILFAVAVAAWFGDGFRASFRAAARVLPIAAALGGYWYVRNTIVAGSPLHPMHPFDRGASSQPFYPALWASTLLGNGDVEVPRLLSEAVMKQWGLAPAIGFLIAPLAVLWLAVSSKWGFRESRQPRIVLAISSVLATSTWLVTPFAAEDAPGTLNQLRWGGYCPARYGLTAAVILFLAFAIMSHDLFRAAWRRLAEGRTWSRLVGSFSLVVLLSWIVLVVMHLRSASALLHSDWVDLALFVINFVLVVFTLSWSQLPSLLRPVAWLGLYLAFVGLTCYLAGRWHDGFERHYARMFNSKVFDAGESYEAPNSCLTVEEMRYYPFFGSRRQHRTCRAFVLLDLAALTTYLRERRVTHLVVSKVSNGTPVYNWQFDRFQKTYPEACRLVWSDDRFAVYEVFQQNLVRGSDGMTGEASAPASE